MQKIDPVEHRQLIEEHQKLKEDTASRLGELSKALEEKDNAAKQSIEKFTRVQKFAEQWKAKCEQHEKTVKALSEKLQATAGFDKLTEQVVC
jgi:uncharacterized protein (DUF3084 family)